MLRIPFLFNITWLTDQPEGSLGYFTLMSRHEVFRFSDIQKFRMFQHVGPSIAYLFIQLDTTHSNISNGSSGKLMTHKNCSRRRNE